MAELSYWAEQYRNNLQSLNPDLYQELLDSGELESLSIQIGDSAQTAYKQLVAQFIKNGDSQTTAETFANSEVMRQFILPPVEQEMNDEPESEMDAEYLAFLKEECDRQSFDEHENV